jgi:hypothetical protein
MAGLRDINIVPQVLQDVPVSSFNNDDAERMGASQFKRGLRSAGLASEAGAAMQASLEAGAKGDRKAAAELRAHAAQLAGQAGQWSPDVTDFREIDGAGSAMDFVAGTAGQAVRSTLPSLAAGVAGAAGARFAGLRRLGQTVVGGGAAAVPAYQMEKGEAVLNATADPTIMNTRSAQDILDAASTKGAINAAGEAIVPTMLAGKLVGTVAKGTRPSLRRAATTTGQSIAGESVTETVQQGVGLATQSHLNPARDTSQDAKQLVDAAVAGAVGGAVLGGPTSAVEAARAVAGTMREQIAARIPGAAAPAGEVGPDGTPLDGGPAPDAGGPFDFLKGAAAGVNRFKDALRDMPPPMEVVNQGIDAVIQFQKDANDKRYIVVGDLLREDGSPEAMELSARYEEDPAEHFAEASGYLTRKHVVERAAKGMGDLRIMAEEFTQGLTGREPGATVEGEVTGRTVEDQPQLTKKNEQYDATDRSVVELLGRSLPEGVEMDGDTVNALDLARRFVRGQLEPRLGDRVASSFVQIYGDNAPNVVREVGAVLVRGGADVAVPKQLLKLVKGVIADDDSRQEVLMRGLESMVGNEAREFFRQSTGRDLGQHELGIVANQIDQLVQGKPANVQGLHELLGENLPKALALAERGREMRAKEVSTLNGMLGGPTLEGSPIQDENGDIITGDDTTGVEDKDSNGFQKQTFEKDIEKTAPRVYSFRDGEKGSTPYDPVEDKDLLLERMALLEKRYPDAEVRMIGVGQYTKLEGRELDGSGVVLQVERKTNADPLELDHDAVAPLIKGTGMTRDVLPGDDKRDKRYTVKTNKDGRPYTEIRRPGADEGAMYVALNKEDGTPMTREGKRRFGRIDTADLIATMRKRAGGKMGNPAQQLRWLMDGLTSLATSSTRGVDLKEGITFISPDGVKSTIAFAGKETRLPDNLKIGNTTVGGIRLEAHKKRSASERIESKEEFLRAKEARDEAEETSERTDTDPMAEQEGVDSDEVNAGGRLVDEETTVEDVARRTTTQERRGTLTVQRKPVAKSTPEFDKLPAHTAGQKTMTYAGIGSRETPADVLATMTKVAERLQALGYTLRSGGAEGADSAFERGAKGKKEIFRASQANNVTRTIAREIHPRPEALKPFPLNLMARNTNQVFGANLDTPADFVLAWTPDGAETAEQRTRQTGGTGQAIEMAARKGVPVINMAKAGWADKVKAALEGKLHGEATTTPDMNVKVPGAPQTVRSEWARLAEHLGAKLPKEEEVRTEGGKLPVKPNKPTGTDDRRPGLDAGETATTTRKRSAQAAGDRVLTDAEMQEIRDYVEKVLGPQVKVAFEELGHAGEWKETDTENLIRLASTLGVNGMSVAHHEAMHGFISFLMKNGQKDVVAVLTAAAGSTPVRKQLAKLLANEPAALRQLNNPEERIAYMFQFWVAGKINLGPETQGVFGRIKAFIHKVLGYVTTNEKAAAILQGFHSGTMTQPSAAGRVLKALNNRENMPGLRHAMGRALRKVSPLVVPAYDALKNSGNSDMAKVAEMFFADPTSTTAKQGYLNVLPQQRAIWLNQFSTITEGVSKEDLAAALHILQGRSVKAPNGDVARVVNLTRRMLGNESSGLFQYMKQAGVPVFFRRNYFPQVWNTEKVITDIGGFEEKLLEFHRDEMEALGQSAYKAALKQHKERVAMDQPSIEPDVKDYTAEITAKHVTATLTSQNGFVDDDTGKTAIREDTNRPGFTPFMSAVNRRTLDFLDMKVFGEYLQDDLVSIVSTYISQAVRRAEYARRFGNSGQILAGHMANAQEQEMARVRAEMPGATKAEIGAEVSRRGHRYARAVMAMEGTLGYDISPTMRRINSGMLVYQNIRILPLALFSSLIDAAGIVVRGGTVGNGFDAFKRGIGDLIRPLHKDGEPEDGAVKLAELMGTVDNKLMLDALGETYSSVYLYGWAKRLNEKVFQWNGMESWNRSMRVAATQAAVQFIGAHAKTPSKHSARWLAELGLTSQDVAFDAEGRMKVFVEEGLSPSEAAKIRAGVQRWVDSAVLRPNAAQRPAWASDPHYALVFHLKQFTYSFHTVILKRVANEVGHGNMAPAMALLSYVPFMLAADVLKGLLQGGGDEPDWKKGWTVGDYTANAIQRAGLLGIGQFALDAKNMGVSTLGGPTFEQGTSAIEDPAWNTAVRALPGNPAYREALI